MPDETRWTKIRLKLRKAAVTSDLLVKLVIALVLVAVLALMFPRGEAIELNYKVGAVWAQKDLIAPFSFSVFRDEREYARDVDEARKKTYPVFERDTAGAEKQLRDLRDLFTRLSEAATRWNVYARDLHKHLGSAAADSAEFGRAATQLDVPFTEGEWEVIGRLAEEGHLGELERNLVFILRHYLQTGVLDRNKSTLPRQEIALRRGTTEEIIPAERLLDQAALIPLLEKQLKAQYPSDEGTLSVAYKIGIMRLQPNIKFSAAATAQAAAAAADAVPRTIGFVQENERIVSRHERITPEIRLKLDSLRRAKAERGPESSVTLQLLGTALHVTLVVMLYGIYLFTFRKRIWGNNRRLTLIALLILLEGVFAYLTREADVAAPVEFLILVPAASMLLTVIFDSRVGFYGTVIIAYLVGGVRGNDYSIALASLVAGALSVYTVRDMKNRTQIFRSLGFIFLGYGLTILALGLERFESTTVMVEQTSLALLNAVISPMLTYGLLIFFERVFRVTTDLTLLELAQYNHPLLRMLAEQAPGTYHHSMTMATLAEAGAAAVGANVALARVGAYFHDIGKIVKPTYFVENQRTVRSRHDKLSPRMSSLIIAAHVKEGMALAREYDLPEEIVDFIPMHHGTTRIDYFYNKALQLAQNSPDETKIDEIKESDYRYPGPKPQTKETGIMMLADAIEAAVRTIEEPTPQRLEAAIDDLIKKRFEEGELDECPLTLKDLTKIKAAFLSVLVGVYHTRVKYPVDTARRRSRKTVQKSDAAVPERPAAEPPASETAGPEPPSPQPPQPPPQPEPGQDQSRPTRLSQTINEIDKQ